MSSFVHSLGKAHTDHTLYGQSTVARVLQGVMLEKLEWFYRLGLINYFKIGGTPSIVFLICIGIAAYLYIGYSKYL